MLKRNYQIYFFILLLCFSRWAAAQEIPAERIVDWHAAGVKPDFALPSNQLNVLNFGITGDGITNDAPAIQALLNTLNGSAAVIIFPAGNYLLNNPISIPDSIILKGSGSDSTSLIFDLGGVATNCINMYGSTGGTFAPIVSGYDLGSDKIITNNAPSFQSGDYAEICQENGTWDTNPISWANNSVGQIVRIAYVNSDTLVLKNPLRISYEASLNPVIRKINPRKNAGVECLKIIRADEPAEGAGSNIDMAWVVDCRIAGVESDHSVGAHINLHYCSNIEVSGCYFHDAFTYDGSGTRGYGVCMSMHTGECLVENNIFKHLRHAMMVKTGSNGNVFAYNYSIEPNRSEPINDFSGDISLHGHYAYANLFEGNICQNIIIDHYWGPSGPTNTFFRNRAEWFGIIMTDDNGVSTNRQNFAGNEITQNGYNFVIQLWFGLYYILKGNDHFERGNNSGGTTIPSGTTELSQNSLYLDYAPEFWSDEIIWPSIGYPNNLNEGTIPAKNRYYLGGIKTYCPPIKTRQTVQLTKGWSGISLFIDPYPQEFAWLFQPFIDGIEIIYNDDGVFYPSQNINTLEDWNYQNAYIIKLNEGIEITFSGNGISGELVSLNPGWNLFPVLSQFTISADTLAALYENQIVVIKEVAGKNTYWPDQQIYTLRWLLPGKAYFVKFDAQ